MIAPALEVLGAQVMARLDSAARAVAEILWDELSPLGRARALSRLAATVVPDRGLTAALSEDGASDDPDAQALRLATARLLLALGPTTEKVGLVHLRDTLRALEARARDGHEAAPHADLAAEVRLGVATLLEREVVANGSLAAARVALAHAELGAADLAADALGDGPDLVPLLEAESARPELDPCERDFALALAGEIARRGEPAAYTAFLARNLDRHPRLLDRLVERAREALDWERVLELARRGLALREDRARYNALAALALERLGRTLP